MGIKVLVVDIGGGATLSINCEPPKTIRDVLAGNCLIPDTILKTHICDLVPFPESYYSTYCWSPLPVCDEAKYVLASCLRERNKYNLSKIYDFIIIDAERDRFATDSAIAASDTVIIPCMGSRYSLNGAKNLLCDIEDVAYESGRCPKIDGLLQTRYDRTILSREYRKEIAQYCGENGLFLYSNVLRECSAVNKSLREYKPITSYKMEMNGMWDAHNLAVEFLSRRGIEIDSL